MARFFVDEDLPYSLAQRLIGAGHIAEHVHDHGLRGRSDEEVFAFAQSSGAVLLTADLDFTDIRRFPPGEHHGIVVSRLPTSLSIRARTEELIRALSQITESDMQRNLVIVEPGRVRIRRAEQ